MMADLNVTGLRARAAWEAPVFCPICHEEIRGGGHAVSGENPHSYFQRGATPAETVVLCDRIMALKALVFDAINEIFCGATYASDRTEVFYALDQRMHALTGKRRGGKPQLIDQRDRALALADDAIRWLEVPEHGRGHVHALKARYATLHAEITVKEPEAR